MTKKRKAAPPAVQKYPRMFPISDFSKRPSERPAGETLITDWNNDPLPIKRMHRRDGPKSFYWGTPE